MQRLSFILILLITLSGHLAAQNPHGEGLVLDCRDCHTSGDWNYVPTPNFTHENLGFDLEGRHQSISCVDCHSSLKFEEADANCVTCHEDVHSMSVGNDCIRCHDSNNWLVDDIPELHEANGFPLLGQHQVVSCSDCHQSETNLRWDRIGNDCASCHLDDYNQTQNPNHAASGFSITCTDCHDFTAESWAGAENFHFFFPLTGGHQIADCNACHDGSSYSNISPDCISCHESDYNMASNPDHKTSGFSTDCTLCHTIQAWSPASFRSHDDEYFPIYSGTHRGEWDSCVECHTTPGTYTTFSCIDCHEHNNASELTRKHDEVRSFVYESNACYSCHPNGRED
jgi:Zn finger protein HypA/HybF involved in hydrogenase expression